VSESFSIPATAVATRSETELVLRFFGGKRTGNFVDVGANDPEIMSQSWTLEQLGWRGILVEPLPKFAERLRRARPNSRVIQAACGPTGHPPTVELHEAECSMHSGLVRNALDETERYVARHIVPMVSLDEILSAEDNPPIDFVSIDVEGMELDVLRGFDLARHAPALLLVEDHLLHLKTHRHLRRAGYRLVKRTDLNNWYVPGGQPFRLASGVERLKLWRKLWLGTPLRAWKHRLRTRAALKGRFASRA
jgi:FkbM family methyltransferase